MIEERGYGKTMAAETMKKHILTVDDRSKISISGVEDVESFDEEAIIVYTCMGTLTLKGADFRISKLNVDSGELVVEGDLDSIAYSDAHSHEKSGGFLGKLFR